MARSEPNFIMMAEDSPPDEATALRRRALRLLRDPIDDPQREEFRRFEAPRVEAAPIPPPPARALMVGLVTTPAVFIVVVLVALALFGKPAPQAESVADSTLEQPAAPRPATRPAFAAAQGPAIELSEDTRVAAIALDGERIALHIESPAGQEIVVYDYAKARVIASAPIRTAALEAGDSLAMLTGAPTPQSAAETPVAPAVKPRAGD
jgi:hypothetical protein